MNRRQKAMHITGPLTHARMGTEAALDGTEMGRSLRLAPLWLRILLVSRPTSQAACQLLVLAC